MSTNKSKAAIDAPNIEPKPDPSGFQEHNRKALDSFRGLIESMQQSTALIGRTETSIVLDATRVGAIFDDKVIDALMALTLIGHDCCCRVISDFYFDDRFIFLGIHSIELRLTGAPRPVPGDGEFPCIENFRRQIATVPSIPESRGKEIAAAKEAVEHAVWERLLNIQQNLQAGGASHDTPSATTSIH